MPGHVHLWNMELCADSGSKERLWGKLSDDERERAVRYIFQADRDRFIIGRGMLRLLVGGYLGVYPESITFHYTPYGRPELPSAESTRLQFNLAHSGERILYAFTTGCAIGVDVERIRDGIDCEAIASRFFSAHEMAALLSLPSSRRRESFFECWTRKEAYIKARGEGLSIPLDSFDVSLGEAEEARLLEVRGEPEESSRWALVPLAPAVGYIGALAVRNPRLSLCCFGINADAEGIGCLSRNNPISC